MVELFVNDASRGYMCMVVVKSIFSFDKALDARDSIIDFAFIRYVLSGEVLMHCILI